MTDIDIDFLDRAAALDALPHVPASNVIDGKFMRHPTGLYVQNIPVDPITGYASLTYTEAAEKGYFKLDFINNSAYDGVRDAAHLDALCCREPLWELLEDATILKLLPQRLDDHLDIIEQIKPRSIPDLAIVLALQRPGKYHLIGKTRAEIDAEIWQPTAKIYFKQSHAVAYALLIVVRLNLIVEQSW